MPKAIAKFGDEEIIMELPDGCRLADLKKRLALKWRKNCVVVVNGKIAGNEQMLTESDRIMIFPIMAGG